eukprot:gene7896-10716_t
MRIKFDGFQIIDLPEDLKVNDLYKLKLSIGKINFSTSWVKYNGQFTICWSDEIYCDIEDKISKSKTILFEMFLKTYLGKVKIMYSGVLGDIGNIFHPPVNDGIEDSDSSPEAEAIRLSIHMTSETMTKDITKGKRRPSVLNTSVEAAVLIFRGQAIYGNISSLDVKEIYPPSPEVVGKSPMVNTATPPNSGGSSFLSNLSSKVKSFPNTIATPGSNGSMKRMSSNDKNGVIRSLIRDGRLKDDHLSDDENDSNGQISPLSNRSRTPPRNGLTRTNLSFGSGDKSTGGYESDRSVRSNNSKVSNSSKISTSSTSSKKNFLKLNAENALTITPKTNLVVGKNGRKLPSKKIPSPSNDKPIPRKVMPAVIVPVYVSPPVVNNTAAHGSQKLAKERKELEEMRLVSKKTVANTINAIAEERKKSKFSPSQQTDGSMSSLSSDQTFIANGYNMISSNSSDSTAIGSYNEDKAYVSQHPSSSPISSNKRYTIFDSNNNQSPNKSVISRVFKALSGSTETSPNKELKLSNNENENHNEYQNEKSLHSISSLGFSASEDASDVMKTRDDHTPIVDELDNNLVTSNDHKHISTTENSLETKLSKKSRSWRLPLILTFFASVIIIVAMYPMILISILDNFNYNSNEIMNDGISKNEIIQNGNKSDWMYLGTKNSVATYLRKVQGSKLVAMRGISVLDMHISHALGPFANDSASIEWVHMLHSMDAYPHPNADNNNNNNVVQDIVHQVYKFPWPIISRDFVFNRKFIFDKPAKKVVIEYYTVSDDRLPIKANVIRGESPFTNWRFQSLDTNCEIPAIDKSIENDNKKKPNKFGCLFNKNHPDCQQKSDSDNNNNNNNDNNNESDEEQAATRSVVENICNKASFSSNYRTMIEIESFVDMKGSIPTWFINHMQRYWPETTVATFNKLAKKGAIQPHPRIADW